MKIRGCVSDENESSFEKQQFSMISGRLHLKVNTKLCVGVEEYKFETNGENKGVALTVQACFPTTWGGCSELVDSLDRTIRPFGMSDSTVCLFKKYSGYNPNDEIWLKTCDASHSNSNKAAKYHYSFDSGSGMIKSEGSVTTGDPLCFKLNSATRFYKQRVKLAKCDSDEVLQKFDFVDGKIHPRSEHRLCAGYEFDRFEEFGQTNFIFSTCFPGLFGFDAENLI